MKTFKGNRVEGRDVNGGFIVRVVDLDNDTEVVLSACESQELINHSPNGFNWGYGGSGPAQLALGILLSATSNSDVSLRYYQDFKWEIVAKLKDTWELSQASILEWIEQQKV